MNVEYEAIVDGKITFRACPTYGEPHVHMDSHGYNYRIYGESSSEDTKHHPELDATIHPSEVDAIKYHTEIHFDFLIDSEYAAHKKKIFGSFDGFVCIEATFGVGRKMLLIRTEQ